jgi:hypothetical protein
MTAIAIKRGRNRSGDRTKARQAAEETVRELAATRKITALQIVTGPAIMRGERWCLLAGYSADLHLEEFEPYLLFALRRDEDPELLDAVVASLVDHGLRGFVRLVDANLKAVAMDVEPIFVGPWQPAHAWQSPSEFQVRICVHEFDFRDFHNVVSRFTRERVTRRVARECFASRGPAPGLRDQKLTRRATAENRSFPLTKALAP